MRLMLKQSFILLWPEWQLMTWSLSMHLWLVSFLSGWNQYVFALLHWSYVPHCFSVLIKKLFFFSFLFGFYMWGFIVSIWWSWLIHTDILSASMASSRSSCNKDTDLREPWGNQAWAQFQGTPSVEEGGVSAPKRLSKTWVHQDLIIPVADYSFPWLFFH